MPPNYCVHESDFPLSVSYQLSSWSMYLVNNTCSHLYSASCHSSVNKKKIIAKMVQTGSTTLSEAVKPQSQLPLRPCCLRHLPVISSSKFIMYLNISRD